MAKTVKEYCAAEVQRMIDTGVKGVTVKSLMKPDIKDMVEKVAMMRMLDDLSEKVETISNRLYENFGIIFDE